MRSTPRLLLASTLFLAAGAARAQDATVPKFQYEKPPEKPQDWKAQAKGGFLMTGGNSQSINGVVGLDGSRKAGDNKVSLEGQLAYGRSKLLQPQLNMMGEIVGYGRLAETTTNQWRTRGRYDRFLTENNAAYVLGQVGGDKIAGKSLFGGGQAGYSRQVFKNAQHTAVAELGYDVSFERYVQVPGRTIDPITIHSARLFVGDLFAITSDTGLSASVEALFNLNEEKALVASDPTGTAKGVKPFKDTRVIAKVGLTTNLWKSLSLGLGATLKYDQNPAPRPIPSSAKGAMYAPGFQAFADEIDTLTEATLIFTFL